MFSLSAGHLLPVSLVFMSCGKMTETPNFDLQPIKLHSFNTILIAFQCSKTPKEAEYLTLKPASVQFIPV